MPQWVAITFPYINTTDCTHTPLPAAHVPLVFEMQISKRGARKQCLPHLTAFKWGIDKYGSSELAGYERAFERPVIVPRWHGGVPQILQRWHPWHQCVGFAMGFLYSLYINGEELRSRSSKGTEVGGGGHRGALMGLIPSFSPPIIHRSLQGLAHAGSRNVPTE